MNITQQAKLALSMADANGGDMPQGSTALIDGVRKFVNVRDLDIDLIDRINPFAAAYAVLAKAMSEATLKQVQAAINGVSRAGSVVALGLGGLVGSWLGARATFVSGAVLALLVVAGLAWSLRGMDRTPPPRTASFDERADSLAR